MCECVSMHYVFSQPVESLRKGLNFRGTGFSCRIWVTLGFPVLPAPSCCLCIMFQPTSLVWGVFSVFQFLATVFSRRKNIHVSCFYFITTNAISGAPFFSGYLGSEIIHFTLHSNFTSFHFTSAFLIPSWSSACNGSPRFADWIKIKIDHNISFDLVLLIFSSPFCHPNIILKALLLQ